MATPISVDLLSNYTRVLQNCHPGSNLSKMFADPARNADVHFVFADERQRIAAHKCLLAVASPVFDRMFFGDLRETGDIEIVDATADAFREFLQFFYCDKVELTQDNIAEVLTLADKYDVAGLSNMCAIYLEYLMNNQTVCWIYDLALMFGLAYLSDLCKHRIAKETAAILGTTAFRKCSKLVLTHILESNELSCDEFIIYTGCMEWASEACRLAGDPITPANCKAMLGPCFLLIRFPVMTAEEFTRCIEQPGLFEATEFLSILSYLTLKRETGYRIPFCKEPRHGTPAWTVKDSQIPVLFCDRRSLPNLHRLVPYDKDMAVFSVNERILLGQVSLSSCTSASSEPRTIDGRLEVKRKDNPADTHDPDEEDEAENCGEDPSASTAQYSRLLQQNVSISSTGLTKIALNTPLVLEPFVEYQIHTDWDLEEGDRLVFRTKCRSEVMVDGGVRFQFQAEPVVDGSPNVHKHDIVEEGMLTKLYFKKW